MRVLRLLMVAAEDIPVDPQGSRSRSTPCDWSCAPCRRCREVSSNTWSRNPGSFFFFLFLVRCSTKNLRLDSIPQCAFARAVTIRRSMYRLNMTRVRRPHSLDVPVGSPPRGWDGAVYVFDINQPSLPTPFYSVVVSVSVFMALSTNCISFYQLSRQLSVF